MFSKTPKELILKDFSNILNKSHAVSELIANRRFDSDLAILTTAEIYAIVEKSYVRCDTFPELQTTEVEDFVNAFDQFYFELKQILFHDQDDFLSLSKRMAEMQTAFETLSTSFNMI